MPRLKRKTVSQKNAAMRCLMRSRRTVKNDGHGDVAGNDDGPGVGSRKADEGRDDPTGLTWSVPVTTVSAVRPSVPRAQCKQTEVKAHLSKPSGSSVPNVFKREPKVVHESLPNVVLESPNIALPDSLPSVVPNDSFVGLHKILTMESINMTAYKNQLVKISNESELEQVTAETSKPALSEASNMKKDHNSYIVNISNELELEQLTTETSKPALSEASNNKNDNNSFIVNISNESELEQVTAETSKPALSEASSTKNDHNSDIASKYYSAITPFNSTALLLGSYSQNDNRFSVFSRGSQCTMNSLCSLIYAHFSSLALKIDEVLMIGDQLYQRVIRTLKQQGKFKDRLLSFDEIPNEIEILSQKIHVHKDKIISGNAIDQLADSPFPSLHKSLQTAFLNVQYVLVMIGAVCSAVFVKDGLFWVFDSHSHRNDGMASFNGKSLLISFASLDDMVTFLYAMYESMMVDLSSQYDILPLKFTCSNDKDELHSNLLKKYFEDQRIKNELSKLKSQNLEKELVNVKHSDRKDYLRKYKQIQRCDSFFKQREKKIQTMSKKKTRNNMDFKKKEKIIQTASKKKARTDMKFKEKEKFIQTKSKRRARTDTAYKEKEMIIQTISKRKARTDTAYKEKEKIIQTTSKEKARTNSDYKEKEKVIQTTSKRKARIDIHYKEKEKVIQTTSKRKARTDINYKDKEKVIQTTSKRKARTDIDYKDKEKVIQTTSKKYARTDADYKEKEKVIQTTSKRKARIDIHYKEKEKVIQTTSKRKARTDIDYKDKEKMIQTTSKTKARADSNYKNKEKVIQTSSKRKARNNLSFKEKEKEIQKTSKQKARNSTAFKEKEIQYQNASRQQIRLNPYNLEKERIAKKVARSKDGFRESEIISDRNRKNKKRKSTNKQSESSNAKRKKHGYDLDECISLFHESIKVGPQYICSCCKQTWFKQSVTNISTMKKTIDSKYLTGTLSVNGSEWICSTCKTNLSNGKVPKLSEANGMKWPEKPEVLQLYPLEERLIALRIPFMQIRELPRGRQYSVKGNVVNVPVDIQPVVNALPRPFDENVTVAVKLKKRLSHKSCAFTENVRPLRVLIALHWLMKNSSLYANSSVTIDEDWVSRVTSECQETVQEFFESTQKVSQNKTKTCHENIEGENTYDSDAEENTQENVGNIDTLVDDGDIENRTDTFTFAPGEGQRPLSIYQDSDSEFLCFPTIYCGERRVQNNERLVPVSFSEIAKWELRSNDRRAANSVPNIFFKLKKIQMKQLHDKVNLAVRRGQFENKMTAGQAKDLSYMENIVRKDEGYYIFKQLRNSPAYLETKKKDVFAMIRQLGLPTWFMSLSSADTRWSDLINMLSSLNQGFTYSEDEIKNLSWEQKIKLVQKDPVTCSRYFDHRVQQFINIVLKSSHDCLGHVTDFFYRVEFQQRGSPHIHMLVWVENAPKYKSSSNDEIVEFVDKHLTCKSENEQLQDLLQLQIHKHSRTCHKKVDKICRFGYPLPPLRQTLILEPLDSDVDKFKKMYEKIQKKINAEKEGYDLTYEKFLTDIIELNEDDYIKCIRSSLKASKVFLKREPKDVRVNLYNETVLRAWKANIDIQFVLDPYACAMYIVSYISKSQRGMSSLLHAAAKEARDGNFDIKRQVRHIGNVFSNSVEVSAQEAVYLVLQMPLSKGTRDVTFINTSKPNDRIQLLKAKHQLDELPDSSTDIVADNVIKRYTKRPKCLENWCLADYVSQLEIVYPNDKNDPNDENIDDDENTNPNEMFNDTKTVVVLKNGIKIRKRKSDKVIRYVRFNKKTDEENHYREKLLLFLPWRNENTDLIMNYENYKKHYESKKSLIDYKANLYEHHIEELEKARAAAENDFDEFDAFDELASGTQQIEAETAMEESVESEKFVYFNPDRVVEHRDYDIGIELGSGLATSSVEMNENVLSDDQYRELLRCLNTKQRHFYNHVIHWIKTKDAPIYAFLTGGAGVGKSVVIKALYQTLYRYLNLREGQNADEKRVLLCAYTGKAAFNINGSTISTAFYQKFMQKEQTLTCDKLNTFRSKYRNLTVIIIDEISMVSNTMLKFIDQRLQELTGTRLPFGGKSIIAVGDLFQLKPVAGSWIFQDLTSDAASLAVNLWKEHFTMFELTEIMRQKDDSAFADLLNRLRHNKMTEIDKEQIKKCEVNPNSETYPQNAPHIFAENSFMQLFNDKIINNINAQKVDILCHDSILAANISQEKQQKILNQLQKDTSSNMGLHHSLTIVIGMIYDLTVNIDTEDGLTNGASCTVKFVEYKQAETNRPSIIWVQFDDKQIGNDRRKKYLSRGFYHNSIDNNWTPIFDIERTFIVRHNTIQRIQFPLQPSAGRTVHRAQGTTLNQVVIDLSQRKIRKNPHIHYVALSRVRSIENLHIINFNYEALSLDERVVEETERLRSESNLVLCYTPLDTISSDNHFKIVYNNCRSLHKHISDVAAEQNILSAHIIGFAETRLVETDINADYLIDGYHLIRNDQTKTTQTVRPHHGLALYAKDDIAISKCHHFSTSQLEFTVINGSHRLHEMQLVILYKSPGLSYHNFISTLRRELGQHLNFSKPLVIMGDFNIDVSQNEGSFEQYMSETFHCHQMIREPTTDQGSTLDLVFSNCNDGVAGTVETYWSDHKLVYFCRKNL